MTYDDAIAILGKAYVAHLWRHPRLADCVAGVRTLQADCAAKGLTSRVEAYEAIVQAMEDVAQGKGGPRG